MSEFTASRATWCEATQARSFGFSRKCWRGGPDALGESLVLTTLHRAALHAIARKERHELTGRTENASPLCQPEHGHRRPSPALHASRAAAADRYCRLLE